MHTASGLLAIFLKFRRKKKYFDQNKALKKSFIVYDKYAGSENVYLSIHGEKFEQSIIYI